ncbi:MAG TPA: MmcQ/YjbR family DNA-binding protein [Egicoccus sp.]|nr:MmcQ/YjbR family DNA-binding protein [Egicoccus sp.]HSK23795.1 MmcQ/YjbR family DNA-binding protein [Egicoccus sp.]
MVEDADGVPLALVEQVRAICLALPEAHEEPAWVGTRWRIRTHTFAHVLRIADGCPEGHARAAGTDGPLDVLTFRSAGEELLALRHTGHPFFAPEWRGSEVGLVLDAEVDWDEVRELLTESYCLRAPGRLVAEVARPAL